MTLPPVPIDPPVAELPPVPTDPPVAELPPVAEPPVPLLPPVAELPPVPPVDVLGDVELQPAANNRPKQAMVNRVPEANGHARPIRFVGFIGHKDTLPHPRPQLERQLL